METIEVGSRAEWISKPEELELAIDKEGCKELHKILVSLVPVAGKVHSVDIGLKIYGVKEEDASDFRAGNVYLNVYPEVGVSIGHWEMYQKHLHKHNYEEYVESRAFTLAELLEHFGDIPPFAFHIEIDKKFTIWDRCKLDVVADSEEEALEKAKEYVETNGDKSIEGIDPVGVEWETLHDTEEAVSPLENYIMANIDTLIPDHANIITEEDLKGSEVIEVVECYKV